MTYFIFVITFFFGWTYFGLKYISFVDCYSKRPTLKEFRRFNFISSTRAREAKPFKYLFISSFILGVVFMMFEPDLANQLRDIKFLIVLMKMLLLCAIEVNYFARHILYDETFRGQKSFNYPWQKIVEVFRRTGWFVKGRDLISIAANLSTIALAVLLTCIFYLI